MAIFCPWGSLHVCCLIRASSHGPGIGLSRFSVPGAALSLSARMVKAASTAPAAMRGNNHVHAGAFTPDRISYTAMLDTAYEQRCRRLLSSDDRPHSHAQIMQNGG